MSLVRLGFSKGLSALVRFLVVRSPRVRGFALGEKCLPPWRRSRLSFKSPMLATVGAPGEMGTPEALVSMFPSLGGPQSPPEWRTFQRSVAALASAAMKRVEVSSSDVRSRDFANALKELHYAEQLTVKYPVEDGNRGAWRALRALVLNNMACCYRKSGNLKSALKCAEAAVRLSRDSADVQQMVSTCLNLSVIYSALNRHTPALSCAQRALKYLHGAVRYLNDLAQKRRQAHRGAHIVDAFGSTLKPSDELLTLVAITFYNVAVEQEYSKKYHAAERSFRHAYEYASIFQPNGQLFQNLYEEYEKAVQRNRVRFPNMVSTDEAHMRRTKRCSSSVSERTMRHPSSVTSPLPPPHPRSPPKSAHKSAPARDAIQLPAAVRKGEGEQHSRTMSLSRCEPIAEQDLELETHQHLGHDDVHLLPQPLAGDDRRCLQQLRVTNMLAQDNSAAADDLSYSPQPSTPDNNRFLLPGSFERSRSSVSPSAAPGSSRSGSSVSSPSTGWSPLRDGVNPRHIPAWNDSTLVDGSTYLRLEEEVTRLRRHNSVPLYYSMPHPPSRPAPQTSVRPQVVQRAVKTTAPVAVPTIPWETLDFFGPSVVSVFSPSMQVRPSSAGSAVSYASSDFNTIAVDTGPATTRNM